MDLRGLRHIAELAKCLNFTKAAENLGISQPVLTRSIQQIEEASNVRLFDRSRGKVELTPAGRVVLQRAQVILNDMDDLEQEITKLSKGDAGCLNIGCATPLSSMLLANVIPKLLKKIPDLDINICVHPPEALVHLLQNDTIDGFVAGEDFVKDSAQIKSSLIGNMPVAVLLSPHHPYRLGESDSVDQYRLLTHTELKKIASPSSKKGNRLNLQNQIVVEDMQVLSSLAQSGDGIWLTSPFVALSELKQGTLVQLPVVMGEEGLLLQDQVSHLDSLLKAPVLFYSRNHSSASPIVRLFKGMLAEAIEDLWAECDFLVEQV